MTRGEYPSYLTLIPNYDPIATAEDCYYDHAAAQEAIDFIERALVFIEGAKAGSPFLLEPWQRGIVANLFGWLRPDGTRRYRTSYIEIPRKNGKTALLSAIMCYVCYCEDEAGAQNYSAASEREQAAIIFKNVSGMIERNPALSSQAHVYKTYKSIEFFGGGVIFKALSSEGKSKHGLNIHCLAVDELHCIEDRELIAALTTAQGARRQPLTIYITTAGVYSPTSLCYETYEYACKVRDGHLNNKAFLPVIYEATKEDAWDDETVWRKANPNLGVSVSIEFLREKCEEAKDRPTKENDFRRLYLNQWTEQVCRWLPMHRWNECGATPSTNKELVWFGGLDMSSTTDLSAFVLCAQDSEGFVHVHCYPFIPKDNAYLRERRDKAPYLTWAKQDKLTMTEGNVIDYDVIRAKIKELSEQYNIKEIAADRWNSTQLITQLQGDGFEIVPFGQGFASMSAPSKYLEQLILNKKLKHGKHPALTWCASNVAAETDAAENIKPSKKRSTERIDCIVALVMALGRLTQSDTTPTESVYESRGILFF